VRYQNHAERRIDAGAPRLIHRDAGRPSMAAFVFHSSSSTWLAGAPETRPRSVRLRDSVCKFERSLDVIALLTGPDAAVGQSSAARGYGIDRGVVSCSKLPEDADAGRVPRMRSRALIRLARPPPAPPWPNTTPTSLLSQQRVGKQADS